MTESGKSAGSADSYIGSLISLTSKYEIRYEGVLYTINTEESTIGLQNVKSFGTEGRKKDGPQIPPNDKVYEYILFRGSDIKDLQVKSSPPTHTEQQIHNDPAIIQSNYPCPPSISSTSASVGGGEPSALPSTAYPVVLPSYQLETHFGSLGSSPAFQNADGASMSMPMYWQAYYGSSSVLPHAQQQSLPFQPSSTISVPLTLQNQSQLPEVQAPLSSSITNLSGRFVPPLIPTADVVPLNFSSDPTLASFATTSTTNKASSLYNNASSTTSNLLHMPLLPSFSQDRNSVTVPLTGKVGSALTLIPPTQSLPHSASSIAASTSISLSTISPTLFTPAQLIQPGPTASLSTHKLYPDLNDMEGSITASSKPSNSISTPLLQGPLLPLPVSTQQLDESVGYSHSSNGEVGVSRDVAPQQHSLTRYTEEFDFIAMNEKFKKDEVWGYLGKAKQINTEETEDNQVDQNRVDGQGFVYNPKLDTKPVYNKDEFFDTLSCNSLRGASNERIRFSERMKHDTETFGEFQERPYLGHGGRNIARGGIYRGSYNRGRGYGYGYGGRGRGGYMPI